MISKFVESYFKWVVPMKKYGMVPEHSFFQAFASCFIAAMPEKFYDKVVEGSIVLKNSHNFSFCEEGIIIDGGSTPIKADVVIFSTGYRVDQKLKDIFTSPTLKSIVVGSSSTIIPLYRFISIFPYLLNFDTKELYELCYKVV